ncbi:MULTISPECIES: nitrite reductase small subunit NirD [Microbacterium]|uniref:nitrite reductase small subunit NirD n=1 Tax=Microbacterium TaxID=33882 RepID=UPI001D17BF5D|nr:nitrite reductase small subunit NirD [Microbacterium testaceum]MCC4250685.1 nitrite reductase small subunit NirD [Microbacterium testaceum]
MEQQAVWLAACPIAELEAGWGETALLAGRQIALLKDDDAHAFAIDAEDPHTGAMVMARGIMGSRGGAPTIASPLHKEVYDLRTGRSLSHPGYSVRVYATRVVGGMLEVEVPA